MGILIDITRLVIRRVLGIKPAGIDRVGYAYVRRYAECARAVLSIGPLAAPLSRRDSARLFRGLLQGEGGVGFTLLALWMGAKDVAYGWIFPHAGGNALLHTAQMWITTRHYARQLRWTGVRPVFFIHDLLPIRHPEFFAAGDDADHHAHLGAVLSVARGVVVNSEDTRRALENYANERSIRCPPLVVAPLASSLEPGEDSAARPSQVPYFVMVGTIEPRKNHLLLLNLWRELVLGGAERLPHLYVVGQRGWECENVIDLLERSEPLRGYVHERGHCNDAELANLLRHAQALLMPTFAEGYGLPVAEALAVGTPVIASDLPPFREIAGDIPEYADPIDGSRWRELILDYAKPDSALRAAQLERMKGYRPMTWERHFEIVDRFLESLP